MPKEMRFCRSCGNRLGEGPAEYTETVRLPSGTAGANAQFGGQYVPGMAGPMTQANAAGYPARRRRLGFSGMTWMWIVLGLFFASGGLMSALVKRVPRVPASSHAGHRAERTAMTCGQSSSLTLTSTLSASSPSNRMLDGSRCTSP